MNLQQAKFLVDDRENSESVSVVIDSLLSSIPDDESPDVLRSIALYVREISLLNPNICHVLLLHIAKLPDPAPFVEVVPSIFAIASTALVEEVCKQLVALMSTRPIYLLPCMTALLDLPLPERLKPQLSFITQQAIAVVPETEFPKLFRILFKSMSASDAPRTIAGLRRKVSLATNIRSC